ncbi:MAG: hypothetical protein CSA62_02550 [Planctomycetota bacterium]|nr:MAG: hypothetical protein CSA62_02550 [Planctomycetota bacterium]
MNTSPTSGLPPEQTGPARHVLIVDDEKALGRTIAYFVRSHGWEVTVTHDVETALERLENDPRLEACISDVYLDEREGIAGGHLIADACKHRNPQIPCLLLTGKPSMQAVIAGLQVGASDFLTKPVDLPLLVEKLGKAIEDLQVRRRLEELEQVNRLLGQILPNTIEAKDPLTRGHSDRVVQYSINLARRVGVAEEEIPTLRLASQLHDIGKIGIPGEILSKPGKLTLEERKIIEEHPEIGYRILEPFEATVPKVREWVLQHHERWDGKGYPRGLKGDEVELPGLILILAEVYDALATQRSYKKPWSKEKIADFFIEEAGRHFHPDLARIVSEGVRSYGSLFFRREPTPSRQEKLDVPHGEIQGEFF